MDEEYEYESLGANSTMAQNAIAGAFAGIGEHCLMYPVDSIKVKIYIYIYVQWQRERERKTSSRPMSQCNKSLTTHFILVIV